MPPSDSHHHHHLIPQIAPPKPNPKILSVVIKALVITFITCLFFIFLGLATILVLLFLAASALHRPEPIPPRPSTGFSSKHLKTLHQFRFRTQTTSSSSSSSPSSSSLQTDCVVCLDAFQEGQWCRKLAACNHVFHRRCVDAWLVKVSVCLICQTRVKLDDSLDPNWAVDLARG